MYMCSVYIWQTTSERFQFHSHLHRLIVLNTVFFSFQLQIHWNCGFFAGFWNTKWLQKFFSAHVYRFYDSKIIFSFKIRPKNAFRLKRMENFLRRNNLQTNSEKQKWKVYICSTPFERLAAWSIGLVSYVRYAESVRDGNYFVHFWMWSECGVNNWFYSMSRLAAIVFAVLAFFSTQRKFNYHNSNNGCRRE